MSLRVPRTVLVTGGAGFIGCNQIRWLLRNDPSVRVVNLDVLTYAGSRANLRDVEADFAERYRFVHGDITDAALVDRIFGEENPDTVMHFAAESHVDRSIDGPAAFLQTNVVGTYVLLEAARKAWAGRDGVVFHHVSTDEVFGSLGDDGVFTADTPYDPSSPYSATKAAADHLVRAWHRTYGLPVTLSNCSNNYGPYQFPEKLVPLMVGKAQKGEALPVYGDGRNVRDWLHVDDHCSAVDCIVRNAPVGTTWLVGCQGERTNLQIVNAICDLVDAVAGPMAHGRARRELITFVKDRPGHDFRYAIDASDLRGLGWAPRYGVEEGIEATVRWYLENRGWAREVMGDRYDLERLGQST
jgi:dTDP-glucose 4,6-dehydratase